MNIANIVQDVFKHKLGNKKIIKENLEYIINGRLYRSDKRFRIVTSSKKHALSINLWNGIIWVKDKNTGKKKLLKRVKN